jgi:hypothetical protein
MIRPAEEVSMGAYHIARGTSRESYLQRRNNDGRERPGFCYPLNIAKEPLEIDLGRLKIFCAQVLFGIPNKSMSLSNYNALVCR